METQTRLSRHNKFISTENIVGIFSVSSDDYSFRLTLLKVKTTIDNNNNPMIFLI